MVETLEQEVIDTDTTDHTIIGLESKVILFNDEIHSFEEVANQLVKAVGCSYDQGMKYANEVHTTGKALVFHGEMQECLKVSSILEEIALHTQIES